LFVSKSIFGANKKPFIYHEVIDLGGEPIKNTDYTPLARVTEFKYGMHLSDVRNAISCLSKAISILKHLE
jgi:hypothetical protein